MAECPCCREDNGHDNTKVIVCRHCGYDGRSNGPYNCSNCGMTDLEEEPAKAHSQATGHNIRGIEVEV
jgi:hypothetical protein